jgi:hypothetical protein
VGYLDSGEISLVSLENLVNCCMEQWLVGTSLAVEYVLVEMVNRGYACEGFVKASAIVHSVSFEDTVFPYKFDE